MDTPNQKDINKSMDELRKLRRKASKYSSNIPMTPQDVGKSVEPDPQNDEICRLRSDLAKAEAENERLKYRAKMFLEWLTVLSEESPQDSAIKYILGVAIKALESEDEDAN